MCVLIAHNSQVHYGSACSRGNLLIGIIKAYSAAKGNGSGMGRVLVSQAR